MTMRRGLVLNGNPMQETAGFSRAVRVSRGFSIGKTVDIGDAAAQSERCFEIARGALERASSDGRDAGRGGLILTDIQDRHAVAEDRKHVCRGAMPDDTILQASRVVNPEWLVGIEVDAATADQG